MTSINKIFIFIVSIVLLPTTSFLTVHVNDELNSENYYINKLRDTIDLCEDLNWEASSLHYNLKSLDWYVWAMVNDGLVSIEEGNNSIRRFIIENSMTTLEIEDRSGINDYSVFKNNPSIITKYYIIDLYDKDYFNYNYTYDILINEYGENSKPFTIFFEIDAMDNIVETIELQRLGSLKDIQFYFNIIISLFGFTITLLAIKEKIEEKQKKKKQTNGTENTKKLKSEKKDGKNKDLKKDYKTKMKHILVNIGSDFLPFIIFGFCLGFFGFSIYLYLKYFFF